MALVRCDVCGKPKRSKNVYIKKVLPYGGFESALICGRKGCSNQGYIWLTKDEVDSYDDGVKIFEIASNATKIKAS